MFEISYKNTVLWLVNFSFSLFFSHITQANTAYLSQQGVWQTYIQQHISQDGRVIDYQTNNPITTSEGQVYSLFFALVNNDKKTFSLLLTWTVNNLAKGDISHHLPAWLWGKRQDGSYGVIDSNPASDADLWLAYTLLEAARLWGISQYNQLSNDILQQIIDKETSCLPGLGLSILPAPHGFKLSNELWRLNPSYLPLFLLKRLTETENASAWKNIYQSAVKTIIASAKMGMSPDWVLYSKHKQFHYTEQYSDKGSYDALRVYLWAGMLHQQTAEYAQLKLQFEPFIQYVKQQNYVPENVFAHSGKVDKVGGVAFHAALLPLLKGVTPLELHQQQYADLWQALKVGRKLNYYQSVIVLFSLSFMEGKFYFGQNGQLEPLWAQID